MNVFTKIPPLNLPRVLLTIVAIAGHCSFAYDSPNFDFKIFDRDAIIIPQNDKDSVVEALNAVAANFPTSSLIDDDLREKSLALALGLAPLNVNSRNAHSALLAGRRPEKTAFFQTSVSEVSERLWDSALKMSGKQAEPECRKLARYLEELSLVLHPSPPLERVQSYLRKAGGQPREWGRFIKLQPSGNPSHSKMNALLADAKANRIPRPQITETQRIVHETPPSTQQETTSSVALSSVEIPFVAHIRSSGRRGNIGGTASIDIKKAKSSFFGMEIANSNTQDNPMRLFSDPKGITTSGFERAEKLAKRSVSSWPKGLMADIRFESESPRSPSAVDTSLAASLLLQSALTGAKPETNLIFSGYINDLPSTGEASFSVGPDVSEVLEQARGLEAEFLLMPESQYDDLVNAAVKTRQLKYLFDPQIISYSTWDQLKSTAFGEAKEQRDAASLEFKKIQAVQDQMTLVDLSKNDKVRERLNHIIAKYPQHLSARVMLAFGEAPEDEEALSRASIVGIDDAISPFIWQVVRSVRKNSLNEINFQEMKSTLEEADKDLALLLKNISPDAKNYLYQAKELLNVTKDLIDSGSRDSTRLKNIAKAYEELELERSALGLDPFRPEERLRKKGLGKR